jgi:ABC-type lipoprotein export system ATPase subunit
METTSQGGSAIGSALKRLASIGGFQIGEMPLLSSLATEQEITPSKACFTNEPSASDTTTSSTEREREGRESKMSANLSGGQWQRVALSRAFMRASEADLVVFE